MLATGQAHKELFHNEALARIDFLIQPTVQAIATDPSAVDLSPGQAWIVGSAATGDWLDHDDQIAGWTGNGWLFIRPLPLMRVYIEPMDSFALYRGSWLLVDDVQKTGGGRGSRRGSPRSHRFDPDRSEGAGDFKGGLVNPASAARW